MEERVWTDDMLWSGVILTITFVGLFTEAIHGIHRTKVAMLGAGVMIAVGQVVGFYDSERRLPISRVSNCRYL